MPPAGNQPSSAANTIMNSRASQKVGIDTAAKENRLIPASSQELGRRAAAMPSPSASAKASAKLDPINRSELPRRGSKAAATGAANSREYPRSPPSAAPAQAKYRSTSGRSRP